MPFGILHVAAMPFPSAQGTQVYIRQMCEAQARAGHAVHLLTYSHGAPDLEPPGYTIHRVGDFPRFRSLRSGPTWQKVFLDLRMAGAVRRLFREIGPDVVHAHHYEALAACLLAGPGLSPLLYHAHTLLEPELPFYFRHPAALAAAAAAGLLADSFLPARAAACAAISPRLADALVAHGAARSRVTYVPPSLRMEDGSGRAAGKDAECDLVYAGNLDAYQGVDDVLGGVGLLLGRRGRRTLTLRIISDSDPGPSIALAQRLGISGSVSFEPHGDFRSVHEKILRSRIALAPRRIPGGFPMKLINYLHARRPVIASVHGSVGLRHRREAMVYDSPEGFVHCALELLRDGALRESIALAGYETAREKFNWDASLKILDGIYSGLIGP